MTDSSQRPIARAAETCPPLATQAEIGVTPEAASGDRRGLFLMALGISLVAGVAVILPFFRLGNASGHDFEFHLASWLEVARQWRQGIVYPRWHEWANHGFGEPRFIFYPPLSWMFGAALSFVAPWNAVPAVFIIVTQTIAGLSAFALSRRLMSWRGALLASACYAVNPYSLLVVYVRSDFAEQLASAILPLLVIFALEICGLLQTPRRKPAQVAAFALVFAAIWLCNAPAGVLASYAVAAVFGWVAIRKRNWLPLAPGGAGLALGLALAAFYLIPAAYEQKWVNIGQALSAGLTPAENFLFTATNDPEHDRFNRIASEIALLMVVIALAGGLATWLSNRNPRTAETRRETQSALCILAIPAALLTWRWTLPVWTLLPNLRFVQFPWRWTLVLAVPYAVWLGAFVAERRKVSFWGTAVAMAAISITTATYLAKNTWWDRDDVTTLQSWLASGQGFEGVDEYDPADDDRTDLPLSAPPVKILAPASNSHVSSAIVVIHKWTAEQKLLHVRSHGSGRLALRLLNYPAWRVEVNSRAVAPAHPPETQQMLLPVTLGESTVKITFERTADRVVGAVVSVLAGILTIVLFFFDESRPGIANL